MCAAPAEPARGWASPEELDNPGTAFDAFTEKIVVRGLGLPSMVARAVWFIAGPASVFARIGMDDAAIPPTPSEILDGLSAAGAIPSDASSGLAFSLIALPAWLRDRPNHGEMISNFVSCARPLAADADTERELSDDVRRMVAQHVTLQEVRTSILELPGVNVVNSYLERPVWTEILDVVRRKAVAARPTAMPPVLECFHVIRPRIEYEVVPAVGPGVDGISYSKKPRAYADILQKVRMVYREMDPTRYFAATKRGATYQWAIPPRDDGRVLVPTALTETTYRLRLLWLYELFSLYLKQYAAFTLNVAHFDFVNSFFAALGPALGTPGNFARGRDALRRASVRDFAEGVASPIIKQVMVELTQPGLAYTYPVTEDELRCWVWCSLERVHATDATVTPIPAGGDADAREALRLERRWAQRYAGEMGEYALTPDEIANVLQGFGMKVSRAWLDAVYAQWRMAHTDEYPEGADARTTDEWMDSLRDALADKKVSAETGSLPRAKDLLEELHSYVLVRFFLHTFYEDEDREVHATIAQEIERQTSVPYALQLGQLQPVAALETELQNFLSYIWLPMTSTLSSPEIFYALHASHPGLFIATESRGVMTGLDVSVRQQVVAQGGLGYQPPEAVLQVPETGLTQHVFNFHRDHISAYNWYAAFFRNWAVRNSRALSTKLSYVARLDAYERMAYTIDILRYGTPLKSDPPFRPSELINVWLSAPVSSWPLYKEWRNIRVSWVARVTFSSTERTINVLTEEFNIHDRVAAPVEIRGSTLWAAIEDAHETAPFGTMTVTLECHVRGRFVVARPSRALENVDATGTCIFTIRCD